MGAACIPKGARAFRTTLVKGDLIDAASVALVTTDYVVLGKLQVEAKTIRGFGYSVDGSDELGNIYFAPKTAAAVAINGYVRLIHQDANGVRKFVVWEGRTENLSLGATDPRLRVKLPALSPCVGEDGYLVLEMKGDAADTVDKTQSTIYVDSFAVYL